MKTCGVCHSSQPDAAETCSACGEASWVPAPSAAAKTVSLGASASGSAKGSAELETAPAEEEATTRKTGRSVSKAPAKG